MNHFRFRLAGAAASLMAATATASSAPSLGLKSDKTLVCFYTDKPFAVKVSGVTGDAAPGITALGPPQATT